MTPRCLLCCVAAALLAVLAGCASRSQLAQINAEKEQLKALIESEKKRNEELAAKLESASRRAAEAERELALLHDGKTPRDTGLVSTPVRKSPASPLEQWAGSEPLLKYDPQRRTARFQIRLDFSPDDRLTLEDRRELDKVADLVAAKPQGLNRLRIRTAEARPGDAHAAARANAVADYLMRRGIVQDRLEVAAGGSTEVGQSVAIEIIDAAGETVASDPSKQGDGWSAGRR